MLIMPHNPALDVAIAGLYDLKKKLAAFQPHAVVSITNPGHADLADEALADLRIPILRQAYHDILKATGGHTSPASSDLSEAMGFLAANWKRAGMRVLVHCHAGISRSPAMAATLLAYASSRILQRSSRAEDASAIADAIALAAPRMLPNSLILNAAERAMPEWRGRLESAMRGKAMQLLVEREARSEPGHLII
ncbi:dual specificity protein phosphatase family protein [Paracoccus litorisediminis]|uniref:dual specificity protein phosphatase family protein n=1 Tax=Paracoccus litorisediminis TaxID=2006130 RepID=UPI003733C3DD